MNYFLEISVITKMTEVLLISGIHTYLTLYTLVLNRLVTLNTHTSSGNSITEVLNPSKLQAEQKSQFVYF